MSEKSGQIRGAVCNVPSGFAHKPFEHALGNEQYLKQAICTIPCATDLSDEARNPEATCLGESIVHNVFATVAMGMGDNISDI